MSQWDCFLQNLGEWHGSFTTLTPQGEIVKDTPSILSLQSSTTEKQVNLCLKRFPPQEQANELNLSYTSLSPKVLFFTNGCFSQGSLFWSPLSQSGAELGLIAGDRRLRLIQLFNPSGELDSLVLIREKRAGSQAPASPGLSLEQLLGTWQGQATTIYPDLRQPVVEESKLVLSYTNNQLTQQLSTTAHSITSTATVKGQVIDFTSLSHPVRVLLLPGGASATFPHKTVPKSPFFLEVGWLVTPKLRYRLMRNYDSQGNWSSLTLIVAEKQENY